MQRQDLVTMSGDDFDAIHTKIWLITDLIYSPMGRTTKELLNDIRENAETALNIMDREDYL